MSILLKGKMVTQFRIRFGQYDSLDHLAWQWHLQFSLDPGIFALYTYCCQSSIAQPAQTLHHQGSVSLDWDCSPCLNYLPLHRRDFHDSFCGCQNGSRMGNECAAVSIQASVSPVFVAIRTFPVAFSCLVRRSKLDKCMVKPQLCSS